jgi:PKD repeat protein
MRFSTITVFGLIIIVLLFCSVSACAYNFGPIKATNGYAKPTPTLINSGTIKSGTSQSDLKCSFFFAESWSENKNPLTYSLVDISQGNPNTYFWDFGDGTTSSDISPTHTYSKPGRYVITHTVCNNQKCDHFSITVQASDSTTTNPERLVTAKFSWLAVWNQGAYNGAYQSPINFVDQSLGDPTSWLWDFGDGTTSTLQNPDHIYQTNGTYTIYLTVHNKYGSEDKTAKTEKFQTLPVTDTVTQPSSEDPQESGSTTAVTSTSDTIEINQQTSGSSENLKQDTSQNSNYQRQMADINKVQARKEMYVQNTLDRAVEFAQEKMNYVLNFARSMQG